MNEKEIMQESVLLLRRQLWQQRAPLLQKRIDVSRAQNFLFQLEKIIREGKEGELKPQVRSFLLTRGPRLEDFLRLVLGMLKERQEV